MRTHEDQMHMRAFFTDGDLVSVSARSLAFVIFYCNRSYLYNSNDDGTSGIFVTMQELKHLVPSDNFVDD